MPSEVELCLFFQLSANVKIGFSGRLPCDVISIPIVNFLTGIIAAVVVFSYLGFLSHLTNTPIHDFPLAGPDLVFITYPAALTLLPLPRVWIFFFFLTLILIGIDSQFGFVEVISYTILDFHPKFRDKQLSGEVVRGIVCLFLFLGGLFFATRQGFNILGLVNSYVIFLPMILVGFLHVYIFGQLTSSQCRLSR